MVKANPLIIIPLMFHPLAKNLTEGIPLPELFTNPFDYVPHPLVKIASEQLCAYLEASPQWHTEIEQGKMFGVLVVENGDKELGYLAAFSGYLGKKTIQPHFVPPILDLLEPGGFFALEEANISQINSQIAALDNSEELRTLREKLSAIEQEEESRLTILKEEYQRSRSHRKELREKGCSEEKLTELGAESQRQKGVLKREELRFRTLREPLEKQIAAAKQQREKLIDERQTRSAALQKLTFSRVQPLNANGEAVDLLKIFGDYNSSTPPAGSGECAAPKLLHYAFAKGLRPVAMGEFWWGESSRGEVRHHLHYYAACRGKCHPILTHMLRGLNVEPAQPRTEEERLAEQLTVIYEDEYLVAFNKPSGLPSVRGKNHTLSVQSLAEERYPELNVNNLIVHRLDMDTSGVLIVAKSAAVQASLQQQFASHIIRKRYIALLDGVVDLQSGAIELPLILDPMDRPRQRVDFECGKPAYTRYVLLGVEGDHTRVALYPQTGRTHQLRVHCAHAQGLGVAIVGDRLYGVARERLMLHAEQITLQHPATGRKFTLRSPVEF